MELVGFQPSTLPSPLGDNALSKIVMDLCKVMELYKDASEDPFFSIRQFSSWWQISEQHAYALARQKLIPSVRIGRTVRIPKLALASLLERQLEESSPEAGKRKK
jgi:excisionase family DNA binding protein